MQRRQRILFLLFGVLAAVLFVVDLSVGAVPIPIREVLAALTGSGNDPVTAKIVVNIRLLKAVVALLAGAALAVSVCKCRPSSAIRWQGHTCWASAPARASA